MNGQAITTEHNLMLLCSILKNVLNLQKPATIILEAGDALTRIGLVFKKNEEYSKALKYYAKAIDHYQLAKDSFG